MKAKLRRPRPVAAERKVVRGSTVPRTSAVRKQARAVAGLTSLHAEATSIEPPLEALLEQVSVSGVLSFGHPGVCLDLGRLAVLVGTNGSGKSNFVEIVEFLSALPLDTAPLLRRAGGAQEWLWKGSSRWAKLTARFRSRWSQTTVFDYGTEVTNLGGSLHFMREALSVGGTPLFQVEPGKPPAVFDGTTGRRVEVPPRVVGELRNGSLLAQFRDVLHRRGITDAAETLGRLRFYRHWQLGPDAPVRRAQAPDAPNAYLAEDASNLGVVLSRIRKSPEAKRRLVEAVRAVYAGADDVEVVPEGGALRIFIQEGQFAIPATRLSDGTLHWLCLLAILLDPQPPPLVCIEEPEIALHPDLIQILARLLRDASQRMQIIVTTHSEALVDKFSDTPEVVVVCEREGAETTLRRLNRKDLAVWLQRYSLGELWRKGEIGGTRW